MLGEAGFSGLSGTIGCLAEDSEMIVVDRFDPVFSRGTLREPTLVPWVISGKTCRSRSPFRVRRARAVRSVDLFNGA